MKHTEVTKMSSTFIFARKMGKLGTAILPLPRKEAVQLMREYMDEDFQLGVLGGKDLQTVMKVYGEYAPYHKVDTVEQLLDAAREM